MYRSEYLAWPSQLRVTRRAPYARRTSPGDCRLERLRPAARPTPAGDFVRQRTQEENLPALASNGAGIEAVCRGSAAGHAVEYAALPQPARTAAHPVRSRLHLVEVHSVVSGQMPVPGQQT